LLTITLSGDGSQRSFFFSACEELYIEKSRQHAERGERPSLTDLASAPLTAGASFKGTLWTGGAILNGHFLNSAQSLLLAPSASCFIKRAGGGERDKTDSVGRARPAEGEAEVRGERRLGHIGSLREAITLRRTTAAQQPPESERVSNFRARKKPTQPELPDSSTHESSRQLARESEEEAHSA